MVVAVTPPPLFCWGKQYQLGDFFTIMPQQQFYDEVKNALETLSTLKQNIYDATILLFGEHDNGNFYNDEYFDTLQAVQDKIGRLWALGVADEIESR